MHLHFKIHGSGSSFFGDGLAFWFLTEPLKPGPVFGGADYFSGISVMIDTYNNHKTHQKHKKHTHPIIAVMVNNGSLSYRHERDGFPGVVGYCEAKVRQVNYETHLSIRYENEELHIKTDTQGEREWKDCVSLKRLHLQPANDKYLGLTASTGQLSDQHDVISLKFYELDTDSSQESRPSIPITYERPVVVEERKSIWGIFFLLFFGLLGTIFLSSYIYIYWKDRKDMQAKQKRMY